MKTLFFILLVALLNLNLASSFAHFLSLPKTGFFIVSNSDDEFDDEEGSEEEQENEEIEENA